MTTFASNCEMPFGKYKGKTIYEIAGIDPEYLIWAHNNIEWFKLEQEFYDTLEMDIANDPIELAKYDSFHY